MMPSPTSFSAAAQDRQTLLGGAPSSNLIHVVPREGIMMILSPAKTFDLSPIPQVIENDYLIYTQPDDCCCCDDDGSSSSSSMEQTIFCHCVRYETNVQGGTPQGFEIITNTGRYYERLLVQLSNRYNESFNDIFLYSGAAYQGIAATECDVHTILYMQDNVRILDALYGVLRPLDQIQPYRLEMNTKDIVLPNTNTPIKKLSTNWTEAITKRLIKDSQQQASKGETKVPTVGSNELPIVLNLASEEYTAAMDTKQLSQHVRFIKVLFYEE
jgi:uncharacterized protein